ncbi:MAG: hypothetical protein J6K25_10795 [Thermoguttaceae bacterium]|nr:hypothetical protein [Thermoguttaceae bacterium]
MLSGVGIVCFIASYCVVLILEIADFRAGRRAFGLRWGAVAFAVLGAIAQTAFLYHHHFAQHGRFLSTPAGWFYLLALGVIFVYLYLTFVSPKARFGLFLVPLALLLCGVGVAAPDAAFDPNAPGRWARGAHGVSLLFATLLSLVGSISGAMFFLRRSRLKRKVFVADSILPTLEWSTRATCFSANGALLFLGIGVASGHCLHFFASDASTVSFFGDPIALGATALFVATVLRRLATARSTAVDEGAEAAFFTIVCSATLAVLLLFVALSGRGHWRDLSDRPAATRPVEAVPSSQSAPVSQPLTPPSSVDAPEKTEKTPDSAFSAPNVSTKFAQNAPSLLANVASRRQNKEARFFGVRPLGVAPSFLPVSFPPFPFVDAAPSFVKESFSR